MDERLQDFFKGVSTAMSSNTIDIIILLLIAGAGVAILIYVYYIYPKYNEYVYRQKLLYFFKKRYLLKSYEMQSLIEAAKSNSIIPEYLIFTSRAAFESNEKDILRALKRRCPEGVNAENALVSVKERLND
jgi:hypothetical protein